MKPRLDSLPMTHEDTAIWCHVFLKAGGWPEWTHGRFQRSDRRDADLMYELMKGRKTFRERRRSYERLRRYALSIGGTNRDWPE